MKIYLFILLALLISCSDITPLQSNKVYSIEEVKTVYRYDAGGSGFRKVAGGLD